MNFADGGASVSGAGPGHPTKAGPQVHSLLRGGALEAMEELAAAVHARFVAPRAATAGSKLVVADGNAMNATQNSSALFAAAPTMAANSSVLFAAAPPPPSPLTLDDQLAQLTLIGGTSNALIHQSFRILSLVAQQHASDVRGRLARTSSPKNKQNLLDSFRVLLSKSANTASLALAFGFWSFEETFGARKMQLVHSLKAAGKWPLPALPAAATERSGRLVVLGLRWQQAGFAKHYHALLPLNIGLGISRSHAVQLAHEASLASASGSMVGVAKASLMLNSTSRRSGGRRGRPSTSTT